MSRRFFVIHEARADFDLATELADRVMIFEVAWLDESLLDSQRTWIGEALTWKSIPERARELGIRVHGHFDGEPGQADAAAARRAILYLLRQHDPVEAILLIRDQDDQPERRKGLEQARKASETQVRVVIGLAIPERECWVLCGFDPRDDAERMSLDAERQNLGFHPCRESHQLTACKDDRAKRSPKRVHRELIGANWEREKECWTATPLPVLAERGLANGLKDYLEEIKDRLVPLITGPEEHRRDQG